MREAHTARDSALRTDLHAIKEDLTALKSDLSSAMSDLIDAGKSTTADARDRIRDSVAARLHRIGEAVEELGERGKAAYGRVRKGVEDRPMQSVGLAFGAGALAGVLWMFFRRK